MTASDPVLLEAARKQLRTVLASGDPMAFLGWREAWIRQAGIDHDDLIDVVKTEIEHKADQP
jgi:hypothetical protein